MHKPLNASFVKGEMIYQYDLVSITPRAIKGLFIETLFRLKLWNTAYNNLFNIATLIRQRRLQKRQADWVGIVQDFIWDNKANCFAVVRIPIGVDLDDSQCVDIVVPLSSITLFQHTSHTSNL